MSVDNELFSNLEPVCYLTLEHQSEIAAMSRVERLSEGRDILHLIQPVARLYYLVAGELKLVYDDTTEAIISAGTPVARHPIGSGKGTLVHVELLSDATILVVDSDLIDIMMTWEQVPKSAKPLSEAHADTTGSDPMALLGVHRPQAGAFSRLPSANIDELFRRMSSLSAKAGDVIIKQGEEGDFYYLIESGQAVVTRTFTVGGEPKVIAHLKDGDIFGEEAPVSDSRRNATVTMETDGILLKLEKQDFIELLKAPLLNSISREVAEQKIAAGARWIDVRLPSEYEYDHLPGAIHFPLHDIRHAQGKLNKKLPYITYCKTGRRSSAAAFIMSQLGFEVYVLDGGTQGGGEQ